MYIICKAYKKSKRSAWLAHLFYLTKFGFSGSLMFFVPFGALFCLGFFCMTLEFSFFLFHPFASSFYGLLIVFGFNYRKFFSFLDLVTGAAKLIMFFIRGHLTPWVMSSLQIRCCWFLGFHVNLVGHCFLVIFHGHAIIQAWDFYVIFVLGILVVSLWFHRALSFSFFHYFFLFSR